MGYTVIRAKNHEGWLKAREGGIGSSEVGVILGVDPWTTPYQLWRTKVGLDKYEEKENFFMKAGHYLEDAVSRFYSDATGVEIIKNSADEFVVVDDEHPYMRVSPDRTFWRPGMKHNEANKGICECKTTQMTISEDEPPQHWVCQLTYQLGVYRLNYGALAWLTQGREFGYRDINFNQELFDYIKERVIKFYEENVLKGIEPELLSVEDVLTKFPRHNEGQFKQASVEAYENYLKLKDINAQIKALSSEKKTLEDFLKLQVGEAEGLVSVGDNMTPARTMLTYKAGKDTQAFNEERFAEEHPELYAQYLFTKPGSRRFLIK